MIEGASPSRGHRYWPSKARAFERDVDQSCEAIDDCAAAPAVVFLCDLGPATRASLEFSEGRLRKCWRAVERRSSLCACACHGSAERACAIEGLTNIMDVGLVEVRSQPNVQEVHHVTSRGYTDIERDRLRANNWNGF